jgi:hypothetical protein
MRKFVKGLYKTRIAYPGNITPFPVPSPPGFVLLIDNEGNYLTDDNGNYLIVPET